VELRKAIYGTLKADLRFCRLLADVMQGMGFNKISIQYCSIEEMVADFLTTFAMKTA
jgi:hypothetical protein